MSLFGATHAAALLGERIGSQPHNSCICGGGRRMPHLDRIGLATTLAPHAPPIPILLMSANPLP